MARPRGEEQCTSYAFAVDEGNAEARLCLTYEHHADAPGLRVRMTARLPEAEALAYWRRAVDGVPDGHYCEWIDSAPSAAPTPFRGDMLTEHFLVAVD